MDMDSELWEVSGGRGGMVWSWICCDTGVSSEVRSPDTGVGAIDKATGVERMFPDDSVLRGANSCELIL